MKAECNENKLMHQRELIPCTVGDCCYMSTFLPQTVQR